MALPNFLIIGAPKCGTTALHNYMAEHPDIFMSNPKEPQWFVAEELRETPYFDALVHSDEEYEALFDAAGDVPVRGESSALYFYSATAPGRIKSALGDPKLVLLLRQPADRIYSGFHFRQQIGYDVLDDFETIARAWLRDEYLEKAIHRLSFDYSNYSKFLPVWRDTFGPDRLKIFLHDDLKKDTIGLCREIYRYLGVDDTFAPNAQVAHNATLVPEKKSVEALFQTESPLRTVGRRLVPKPFKQALHRYRRKNWKRVEPIDPMLRAEITEHFHDDIDRTAELIGRDLSHWKAGAQAAK